MWIKLAKKYEFYMLPEKLLKYRIRDNNGNLSFGNRDTIKRIMFEQRKIHENFFKDVSIDLFKWIFINEIKIKNFSDSIHYEMEKSFLYLSHPSYFIQIIGIEHLFKILQDESILKIAKSDYNFTLTDLFELTKMRQRKNAN